MQKLTGCGAHLREKNGSDFQFQVRNLFQIHEGSPSFGFSEPWQYTTLPEDRRLNDAKLGPDLCIIHTKDHFDFFIRGCLGIPIRGVDDPFLWGVWISVSAEAFRRYGDTWDDPVETDEYCGWLCSKVSLYPDSLGLEAIARPQLNGQRPMITLEPSDHPLSVDCREGLTIERAQEMAEQLVHR